MLRYVISEHNQNLFMHSSHRQSPVANRQKLAANTIQMAGMILYTLLFP